MDLTICTHEHRCSGVNQDRFKGFKGQRVQIYSCSFKVTQKNRMLDLQCGYRMFSFDKRIFWLRVWLLVVLRGEEEIALFVLFIMAREYFAFPPFGLGYIRTLNNELEMDHSIHWIILPQSTLPSSGKYPIGLDPTPMTKHLSVSWLMGRAVREQS